MTAVVSSYLKLRDTERHVDARSNVIAESYRAQEMRAIYAEAFTDRECSRHDGRAWMRIRRSVRVVRLIGMSKHSIRERRLDGPDENIRAHNSGNVLAAVRTSELDCRFAGHQL